MVDIQRTAKPSVGLTAKISAAQFKSKFFEVCPGFVADANMVQLLNELFNYVNGIYGPTRLLDPSKGLFLWGDIGTGKSTMIKAIGEILRLKGDGYKTVNCAWLANQYSVEGQPALDTSTYNYGNPVPRAFDELGREPMPAKHYGTELNVMQHVLQIRYEFRNAAKTYITTNMRPEYISKFYGTYISDRVIEMFNIIELKGKSFRK